MGLNSQLHGWLGFIPHIVDHSYTLEDSISTRMGANCYPLGLVTACILLEEVKPGVIHFWKGSQWDGLSLIIFGPFTLFSYHFLQFNCILFFSPINLTNLFNGYIISRRIFFDIFDPLVFILYIFPLCCFLLVSFYHNLGQILTISHWLLTLFLDAYTRIMQWLVFILSWFPLATTYSYFFGIRLLGNSCKIINLFTSFLFSNHPLWTASELWGKMREDKNTFFSLWLKLYVSGFWVICLFASCVGVFVSYLVWWQCQVIPLFVQLVYIFLSKYCL